MVLGVKMSTTTEGDFNSLSISDWERTMLEDAYKAVTKAKRWDFLRRPDVPGPDGFMFSNWPQMKDIDSFMEYGGHSGASYGMTMREMEFIAKKGWDAFAAKYNQHKPNPKEDTLRKAAATAAVGVTLNNFLNTNPPTHDLVAFANAIQNDTGMRSMIPDIDEQADALKKFAEGKLSYAEMRGLCG